MRYSKEHKAQAKAAILQAASSTLKEKGFHAVGVDGLAASAQVTSGALYSNFVNKEAVLEELVSAQLGIEFAELDGIVDALERQNRLVEILRMYLSDEHREGVAQGCVMPALSADVSRAGAPVRKAYERKMAELVARLTAALPGAREEREQQAWTVIAAIVGAITVARALPDGDQARAVLDATLKSVIGAIADAQH